MNITVNFSSIEELRSSSARSGLPESMKNRMTGRFLSRTRQMYRFRKRRPYRQ